MSASNRFTCSATWTSRNFDSTIAAPARHPITDGDRFDLAVRQIVGKRLTFDELTGKVGETAVF